MSSILPGWTNPTIPFYAGVRCGNVTQTQTFTTNGTDPQLVAFTDAATWSDTQSFTTEDNVAWNCQTSGVYNLRFNQTVDVTNDYTPPDNDIPVIPNTTFFLDIQGNNQAPSGGNAILHPNTTTQSSIEYTSIGLESDVFMGVFRTPVGFLTNTSIAGGSWSLSLWAATTDITELNSAYISIYTADSDGISNETLVVDGSADTFIVNGTDITNYNHTFTIPTFTVEDLSKRILFKLYANFGVASTTTFYFRDLTLSSVATTISQDVLPLTRDTVNVRLTVVSETDEFNQVFVSSIPITMTQTLGETLTYSTSVNAIANVYRGDSILCTIAAVQGNVVVSSGQTSLPAPANTFQWNLIAEGAYGNPNVIVAPQPMLRYLRDPVVTTEENNGPIISSTTEISDVVLKLRQDTLANPE